MALAIDQSGLLYAGGTFTNWNANANADYVVSYDGASWAALSTGLGGPCSALAIAPDNSLYLGGTFTTAGGGSANRIAVWDGSAFAALGSGMDNDVSAIAISATGVVYVGGAFTTAGGSSIPYIAAWNGSAWLALGDGVNNTVYGLFVDDAGVVYASGLFSTAGGHDISDKLAAWNGSSWYQLDVDLPGAAFSGAGAVRKNGTDLIIGFGTSGIASVSGLSTAENDGTVSAFVRIDVINANPAGTATLQWLESQSSDHLLYFDLDVHAGESVTLDLTQSRKLLTSDWRGRITDNPLPASNVVNWRLLPGINILAAFITGTVTSVMALLHWTPTYWSADGGA